MRAQILGFAEETGTNGQPGGRAPCLRECLWLLCGFNEACSGGGRTQSREEAGVESRLLCPDPVLLPTGWLRGQDKSFIPHSEISPLRVLNLKSK